MLPCGIRVTSMGAVVLLFARLPFFHQRKQYRLDNALQALHPCLNRHLVGVAHLGHPIEHVAELVSHGHLLKTYGAGDGHKTAPTLGSGRGGGEVRSEPFALEQRLTRDGISCVSYLTQRGKGYDNLFGQGIFRSLRTHWLGALGIL